MNRTVAFPRRCSTGLHSFLADVAWLFRHRAQLRLARTILAPAFRERLMLAVAAVNRCRCCSFVHTRRARAAGVSNVEIARIPHQTWMTACLTKRWRWHTHSTGRRLKQSQKRQCVNSCSVSTALSAPGQSRQCYGRSG